MSRDTYIKINGKRVKAEWLEPEHPFIANPRFQDAAMFMAGVGLQAYKNIKTLAGVSLNPEAASKAKKALPWAFLTGLGVFLAPAFGKRKNLIRLGSAIIGLKALNELLVSPKKEQETA